MKMHPFHLVNPSPWPACWGLNSLILTLALLKWFHLNTVNLLFLALISSLYACNLWWRDISRESTMQGMHTLLTSQGLKIGMILFIISEVMFFLSFFWTYLHSSLNPTWEIGSLWPPSDMPNIDPMSIPLLNTIILLSSGVSLTASHHSLLSMKFTQAKLNLLVSIILGILFMILQGYEYISMPFTFSDASWGGVFFLTTGFHGLHVTIGGLFLLYMFFRMNKFSLSKNHHTGFEAAAWYWHFVDVVWLLLFSMFYWWPSTL